MNRVWLSQELDGEERFIEVPASAVAQHVQAGWLPSDPPPKPAKAPLKPAAAPSSPAAEKAKPTPSPKSSKED